MTASNIVHELKQIFDINSTSGDESKIRQYIIENINPYCDYRIDNSGSVIAFKKGKKTPKNKILLSCHMDEVGFIVNYITDDGYLKILPVGGIAKESVYGKALNVNNHIGVVGSKPVHLLSENEKENIPDISEMFVDIGASDRKEAESVVSLGDFAYFVNDFTLFGQNLFKSKAIDDRIGCYILINIIKEDLDYDTYFAFNVQEEVGLRGSACVAKEVSPDISIILEATTANDIYGVDGAGKCCSINRGPVVPFMDKRTIYNKDLYNLAFKVADINNIKIQTKTKIAGGNDSASFQQYGNSRVVCVSLPCRYLHTSGSVASMQDVNQMFDFLKAYITYLYDL